MILVDVDVGLALGALLGLLELLRLGHVEPGGGGSASLFAKLRFGLLAFLRAHVCAGLEIAGLPVDFIVAG